MLRLFILALSLFCAYFSSAHADCLTDPKGKVICGKGHCERDQYGNVFCADVGGGAMRDTKGHVMCGTGYCARDDRGEIWCSTEQGGDAKTDSKGKVVCLGGCEPGTVERCTTGE